MFKSLLTLLRGANHEAAEAAFEGNIGTVLDQQFLDCSAIVEKARRSAALAIAQQRQEKERFDTACHGIADLEARAKWALDDGDEVLAHQAAEVIASLESERDAARKAMQTFDKETRRLNSIVRTAEAQLRELKRGRRTARKTNEAQRVNERGYEQGGDGVNTLTDAEVSLEILRLRQKEIDEAFCALNELDQPAKPVLITRELSEDGYGESIGKAADAVLARLRTPRHTQACSY